MALWDRSAILFYFWSVFEIVEKRPNYDSETSKSQARKLCYRVHSWRCSVQYIWGLTNRENLKAKFAVKWNVIERGEGEVRMRKIWYKSRDTCILSIFTIAIIWARLSPTTHFLLATWEVSNMISWSRNLQRHSNTSRLSEIKITIVSTICSSRVFPKNGPNQRSKRQQPWKPHSRAYTYQRPWIASRWSCWKADGRLCGADSC